MNYVRRVRAARGAVNLSLDTFAEKIGVGRSTLVRIEQGEREPKPDEYAAMARVSGLPLEFFTVPDLADVLRGDAPAPSEIDDLREQMQKLAEAVVQLASGNAVSALAEARRVAEPPRRGTARGDNEQDHQGGDAATGAG